MAAPSTPFTAAQVSMDPEVARAAALTLCDRAVSVEDARMLLEACGLVEAKP
jgi:hypothetical protein